MRDNINGGCGNNPFIIAFGIIAGVIGIVGVYLDHHCKYFPFTCSNSITIATATPLIILTNTNPPNNTPAATLNTSAVDTLVPSSGGAANDMPFPTSTAILNTFVPYEVAEKVNSNDDWEIVEETLSGIRMVLVPAGCFTMGSTQNEVEQAFQACKRDRDSGKCEQEWYEDEFPNHTVCIDYDYWIGRYEITNQQFGSVGFWTGNNQPREKITWSEAKYFCESIGARLPTEAEGKSI